MGPVSTRARRHDWADAAAEAAGLGQFRRLHRQRATLSPGASKGLSIVVVGLIIFLATHSAWLAILIIALLAVAGIIGYMYLAEPGSKGIIGLADRVAIYEHGFVLQDAGPRPRVIRWDQITGAGRAPISRGSSEYAFHVAFTTPDGNSDSVAVRGLTNDGALQRSIRQRGVAGVNWWPRTFGMAVAAAAVGLYVWQLVLPPYELKVNSEIPPDSSYFDVACDGAGTAFSAVPPYSGSAPHPIAVFPNDVTQQLPPSADAQWSPSNPATVQLVACATRVQTGGDTGKECDYSTSNMGIGGQTEVDFVTGAWWNITVYELRTHREIGSATVYGDNQSCPGIKPAGTTVYSTPSNSQLHQVLDKYVQRSV